MLDYQTKGFAIVNGKTIRCSEEEYYGTHLPNAAMAWFDGTPYSPENDVFDDEDFDPYEDDAYDDDSYTYDDEDFEDED